MSHVYVSIGSNIDPLYQILTSLQIFQQHYGKLIISSVYESQAIGFEGNNFYNLVVGFETDQKALSVIETLRTIEKTQGRQRLSEKSFSPRALDLDLLIYDDLVSEELSLPRKDILNYAFVLLPLSEIAPYEKHPVVGQTYAQLWKMFKEKDQQPLWPIEIKELQSFRRHLKQV